VAIHDPGRVGAPPQIVGGLISSRAIGAILLPLGPAFGASLMGWDGITRVCVRVALVTAAVIAGRYALAWYLWERRAATQAAWEVVCAVTRDQKTATERRARFRVRGRRGGRLGITPMAIRVRPGTGFNPGDTKALQSLAARWSAHIQVPVDVTPRNNGWLQLDPAPDDEDRGPQGVLGAAKEAAGLSSRENPGRVTPARTTTPVTVRATPTPGAQVDVVDDLTRAVGTILGDGTTIEITDQWDDASPRLVTVSYPPESAPRADQTRNEIARLFTEMHPPKGRWVIDWRATEKTFTVADTTVRQPDVDPLDDTDTDIADDSTGPDQDARRGVSNDLEAALRPVISDAAVLDVVGWDSQTPTDFYLRYPPPATKKALRSRASFYEVLETLYPAAEGHVWRIDLEGPDRRFHFQHVEDALARPIPLPPILRLADIDLQNVPLGVYEHGQPMTVPVLTKDGTTNYLCVGASGAGKSGPQWGLLRQLGPLIHAGMVKPYLVDAKAQEFLRCGDLAQGRVATSAEDIAELILQAMAAVDAQADRLARAGHTKMTPEIISPEFPLIVLILDEILSLTSKGFFASDVYHQVMSAIARMLSIGRSVGAFVLANSQDPRVQTLPFRCLFRNTLALRLNSDGDVTTVFDSGARNQGAMCDKIPESQPGTGYLATDGRSGYVRLRLAFVDDAERARFLARYTPGAKEPEVPAITPVPAGEQMTLPQVSALEPPPRPASRRKKIGPVSPGKLEPQDRFTFLDDQVLVATVVDVTPREGTSKVMVEYQLPGADGTEVVEMDDDLDTVQRIPDRR
jgi:hypothetical protein